MLIPSGNPSPWGLFWVAGLSRNFLKPMKNKTVTPQKPTELAELKTQVEAYQYYHSLLVSEKSNPILSAEEKDKIEQKISITKRLIDEKQIRIYWLEVNPDIISICLEYFDTDMKTLLQDTRKREIVQRRQIIMNQLYKRTRLSLQAIGDHFDKDHATVIHANRTISNLYETSPEIRTYVDDINKMLNNFKIIN